MNNLINGDNDMQFVIQLKYLSSHIANLKKRGNYI
jgi:hypothetical protein